jgi:alkylation response protein AidB-like acyl-CoA dehydrogenase
MELLSEDVVPEYAREVKREAREFADEYVAPNAEECFRDAEYPWDVLEAGQDAGLVAQDIGEEWGGRGLDVVEMLAVAEEWFRADAGIALTLQLASFGAKIVQKYGTDDQREEYLRPVAEGDQITGLAVSEPDTGSDLTGMETTAEKRDEPRSSDRSGEGGTEAAKEDEDGDEWVLNGEKYWIGNGVEGDWLTVYARTGENPENRYGNHSLFIVPTDAEGYEAEHIPEKMGMRASKQAHIVFDDCRIPDDNLVGYEGAGFMLLAEFFNHGRTVVAGHGLGLAAAAIEEAWEFVHGREEFGRTISDFQAVQHGLADMRMEFESARALTYRAAEKVRDGDNAGLWAAMAKTKATETATDCAEQGMQFHGGRSILTDRRIARVYRDVRIPVVYEGANEIQRNLIYKQS